MTDIPTILAIIPFLFFLFLLLIKKIPLLKTSVITLSIYTVLAIFYWKILPSFLYISYGKGIFIAFDIFIIIFGAIFFLEILKKLQIIKNISYYLSNISKDYRVQIIVIAWLFEAFLEGTAGFGVPAAIAVPILVGLGLTPIRALVVGLLGNSAPGVFGAAGTPIKVGLAGLNTTGVPLYVAMLNSVGIIVPVFMLWIITKDRINRKKEFFEALPFAIWSGIVFIIPSILSVSLGQEFPSIIGSLVGLILIFISIKLNIFVPKNKISLMEEKNIKPTMSPFKSFLPYIILVLFLIIGKIILGDIGVSIFLGFKYIFHFFNPGFIFILSSLIIVFIWKNWKINFYNSIKKSINRASGPFVVIASMLVIVQIMINSGNNLSGLSSIIIDIAKMFETSLLPFFAPFVGAFGALMTGSVTVSNIMFGSLFSTTATSLGLNVIIILSLLVVGAGAGNMVALADILTAEAVLGVKNAERKILKGVIIPCLTYLIIVGFLGIIIFNIF